MDKKQKFLKGALILSAAGLISKILGAVYRIVLGRWIGPYGMGLYQMAYPIYTTVLALATAGVPVAISILIARKESQGYSGDSKRIFRIALFLLLAIGASMTLIVINMAHFFSHSVYNNPNSYYAILAVAPAIFFSALLSVFRGYFQGYQFMTPTAVSQIVEQLFRVSAVFVLAWLLLPRGVEYAVAGATAGAAVGGFISLLFLICLYVIYRRKSKSHILPVFSEDTAADLTKKLVRLAVPISLGAVVLPLVGFLDAVIVPNRLMVIGFSIEEATSLFGQLTGMAAVLIGLPTIFTIAISTSLSPAVSEAFARQDFKLLREHINLALRAGMLISFPCTAGLFILAAQICDLLYKYPEAGMPLEILAFSCITLGAFQISSAGLQAIGRPKIAMYNLIITGILKTFFNYFLTAIPYLNIKGAAVGTVIAFLIGSGLNLFFLYRLTKVRYEKDRMLKIAVVSAAMGLAVYFIYQLLASRIAMFLSTIAAIAIGVLVYVVLLLLIKEWDVSVFKHLKKGM